LSNFEKAVTKHGAFWTFCGICMASCGVVMFLLPETKGRSISDISNRFRGENKN